MEREEKKNINNQNIDDLYSSLNIGSFLEVKKQERNRLKKELTQELFSIDEDTLYEESEETLETKIPELPNEKEPKEKTNKKIELEQQNKKDTKEKTKKKETVLEETVKLELPKKEATKETIESELPKKETPTMEETVRLEIPKKEKKKEEIESSKKETSKEEKTLGEIELDQLAQDFEEPKEEQKKEKKKKKKESSVEEKIGKNKIGKKTLFGMITCIILDLLAFIGLFLTYGPIPYFRNMLVTSAMTTMNHKYLARIFYSEKMIEKVLNSNVVKEVDENTNSSDIDFADAKDTGEYASVYEEQILKREKDQLYKLIEIEEGNYKGYLVAVYDASRVKLVGATKQNYGGAILTDISKKNNAKVAMNASGFYNGGNKGSTATGTVIMDSKVVLTGGTTGYGGGLAGFNKDHVLVLTKEDPNTAIKNGMVDAVEFGPFLIVNGKSAKIEGNGGWGIAPRTVLAQRKDGIVLFLVVDGRNGLRSLGIDMNGLIKILERYGAHNAVNLDGGGSTTLTVAGELVNCPSNGKCGERYIPNAWIVK